jgi:tetratricopeptide (TPR) repeat protein
MIIHIYDITYVSCYSEQCTLPAEVFQSTNLIIIVHLLLLFGRNKMPRHEYLEVSNETLESTINEVLFMYRTVTVESLLKKAVEFQTSQLPNFIAAVDCYDKILSMQPRHIEAHNNRGICFVSQGKSDMALLDFNRVLEIDANNIAGLNNRGALYYSHGKFTEALTDFNRVLEMDATNADALYNIKLLQKEVHKGCCVIL